MYRHPRLHSSIVYITIFSLIITLLLPPFSLSTVHAQDELFPGEENFYFDPQDPIIQPNLSRKDPIEVTKERTANSKRYMNPDGSYTEEIYLEQIHFEENGKWVDIDNSLESIQEEDFKFKNKANRYQVKFSDKVNGNRFMQFSVGDTALEMKPIGILAKGAKKEKNKLVYEKDENATGTGIPLTIEYTVGNNNVKEDIVLERYKKINKLTFQLRLTNLTYKKETDGSIGFYDSKGKKVFYFSRPYMVDSAEGYSDDVSMEIKAVDNQLFIELVPSDAWLKAPDRVYPVRIDPTIDLTQNTTKSDTHISENFPDKNYHSTSSLSVGTDKSDGGLGRTQAFLWFNLPSLPNGSWINSATLSLYQFGGPYYSPTILFQ